jgi:hypothetical protein
MATFVQDDSTQLTTTTISSNISTESVFALTTNVNSLSTNSILSINNLNNTSTTIFNNLNTLSTNSILSINNLYNTSTTGTRPGGGWRSTAGLVDSTRSDPDRTYPSGLDSKILFISQLLCHCLSSLCRPVTVSLNLGDMAKRNGLATLDCH